jgi:hypothetical protein
MHSGVAEFVDQSRPDSGRAFRKGLKGSRTEDDLVVVRAAGAPKTISQGVLNYFVVVETNLP